MTKRKSTNNNVQSTTQKTTYQATQTSQGLDNFFNIAFGFERGIVV
jgi:hypothetical protein